MTDYDLAQRAREAYEEAFLRVSLAREQWKKAGEPLTMTRPSGVVVVHPLLTALRLCEADAAKRLERARTAHRGPAPSAVVGITESPAERIRRVK